MDRKTLIEFIFSWFLIIMGGVLTTLPLFKTIEIEKIFILILVLYGLINLIKNILTIVSKDYSGFYIAFACLVAIILAINLNIEDSPWNLALTLFIWIIIMSLIKLKKSDYYHDRKNKLWKLNVIHLILFIICGVLTTLNLNYDTEIQLLVLGFFFLINGILEMMNPICAYLLEKN